jgi:hypothetical protein
MVLDIPANFRGIIPQRAQRATHLLQNFAFACGGSGTPCRRMPKAKLAL